MRTAMITSSLLVLLMTIAGSSPITAQAVHVEKEPGFQSQALLDRADRKFDLENEDAVILFQRFETKWTADGRLVQTTTRSVLINTEYGLDHFADLRIPWDGARQELTVERLRTLRLSDEAVIDAGPTAVVETLPFRVDRAPDYCHLRETMLLHDGVELPCILETIWTVEDTEPFRPGASGTYSLMGTEPALVSQFSFSSAGVEPVIHAAGGAPQPVRAATTGGYQTWTVEMEELAASPLPETDESVLLQPRVCWSTWASWDALAEDLDERFDAGMVLDDEMRDALNEKLEEARTPMERARLTAEFIDQTTRLVRYGSSWWPAPRPASRTWGTGYGHRVDRTVLGAILYRIAGFTVHLGFRGSGYGEAEIGAPNLAWSDGAMLKISGIDGETVEGWFDPGSAAFSVADTVLTGRTVWMPGEGEPAFKAADGPDRMLLRFDLGFDAEKKSWAGTGVLTSEGTISPYSEISGLGTEAKDWLTGFVGSFLNASKISSCNLERMEPGKVVIGFALEVPAGERDTQGRLMVEVASFPADHFVDLHVETRESDFHLPAPVSLQVILKLDPGDLEVVHLPEHVQMRNAVGHWKVSSEVGDEEKEGILFGRELQLPGSHIAATRWPELRALLLADENRADRMLLFK